MATMRPYLRKFEPGWITLWAIGVICGVLLMTGVNGVRHTSRPASSVAAIGSTAIINPSNQIAGLGEGRTQFVDQSAVAAPTSRVTGPGEGLNEFVDQTSFAATPDHIVGLGEGLNQFVDQTSFTAQTSQIVGPGEGLHLVP